MCLDASPFALGGVLYPDDLHSLAAPPGLPPPCLTVHCPLPPLLELEASHNLKELCCWPSLMGHLVSPADAGHVPHLRPGTWVAVDGDNQAALASVLYGSSDLCRQSLVDAFWVTMVSADVRVFALGHRPGVWNGDADSVSRDRNLPYVRCSACGPLPGLLMLPPCDATAGLVRLQWPPSQSFVSPCPWSVLLPELALSARVAGVPAPLC